MKTVVIKLGGSLITPDKIDIEFVKEFRDLIKGYLDKFKFIIICGGGRTARKYRDALNYLGVEDFKDLDLMGIAATRINAELMKFSFQKLSHNKVIHDFTSKVKFDKVLFACGWKEGHSTDYDAVMFAKQYGADKVIVLSNVPHIFTADPAIVEDAKPIKSTTVGEYLEIVGEKWTPGRNVIVDPSAAKSLDKGMELIVINTLDKLNSVLSGKKFEGSTLSA